MKKFISLMLCVVMLISVFSATAGQVFALGNASQMLIVESGEFADDKITFTVSLAANQTKVTGAIFEAHFDSEVLEVVEAGAVGSYDAEGDFVQNVSGIYETGLKYNDASVYSVGFMNATGYTIGDTEKEFVTITFRAKSAERAITDVEFKCVEFATDDGDDSNDIKKTDGAQDIYSHSFHTLSMPKVTEVNSVEGGLKVVWSESEGATSYELRRKAENETVWQVISSDIGVATEFLDTDIVEGKEYFYTVSAANEYGSTEYDEIGLAGLNFGSISSINAVATANGAAIEWSALAGAQSYEVYRKLASSSNWQLVGTVTNPEYTDETIASGVVYNYKVRAIKGKYSAGMSCDPASVKFLAAPETTVSNIDTGIEIFFEQVNGAESYVIEKKVLGGEYSVIAEIPANTEDTYIDEDVDANGKYVYRIQAIASDISSVKVELAVITRLGEPVLGDIKNIDGGIELKWSAVDGATEYVVYRSTTSNAEFSSYKTVSGTSFVDTDVASGATYYYTVSAQNASGCGSSDEAGVDITYLSAPKITSVAAVNEGINVAWGAIYGAESYNVYRVESGKTNWTLVANTTDTSFDDTTVTHGVYYKYSVSAVAGDSESVYNKTGVSGMYFGTVKSISASAVTNGAYITWEALEKADSYEVFRKTADDTSWTSLGKVKVNKYTDTAMASGVVYYYMVKAYNGVNVSEMTAAPAKIKILATPTGIVKNVNSGIQITITPVDGAEGYVIQKKVNGVFKTIKTLAANETVYVDTDVKVENQYTYRVYATSSDIDSFAYELGTILRLGCPKIVSASNLVPGITMTWTPIDDAVGYEVLRKAEGQSDWEVIAKVTETTYVDALVENDTVYTYTISALLADGGKTGYDEKGRSVTFVETPDLISVSNAVDGVLVKWYAIEGATSYRVYRRGAGSTYWKYLGDVKGTSFTDKSSDIVSGGYYRYTVRAVNTYYSGFSTEGLYLRYVATPKLTGISNSTNGIYIKWTAVKNATGYRVYRRGAGATSWYYLGTTKNTYFTDTAIKNANGKYYRYTVRAVCGVYSAFDTTGLYIKRLSDPVLSSATSARAGITVKWKGVTGATGYYVYRKTPGKSWTRIAAVKTTSYLDKTAKKGTTYTYTVRAYSGSTMSYFNTKGISRKDVY